MIFDLFVTMLVGSVILLIAAGLIFIFMKWLWVLIALLALLSAYSVGKLFLDVDW